MSNRNVEAMPMPAEPLGYERSRLNAVRHGILSQHLVLPWEDRSEYDDLFESLVAEHRPNGPTEQHLVEELAGLLWRKQRLTIAEASAQRAGLHRALEKNPRGYDRVLVRALVHLDGGEPTENAAAAIRATAEDTEAELRDLAERRPGKHGQRRWRSRARIREPLTTSTRTALSTSPISPKRRACAAFSRTTSCPGI